ncbi:dihydroneopterin aldolase [Campylobacter sp. TTU-622]|uniref:disulfide bond formation protein Dba n=1 Tax=unclassified Campylobacter TaxID=2593542 RepID=UPI0019038D6B|nr:MULTISPECIES: dihydroneopterin aldolase [unclassified Campylobacter]MBK1971259.1 dihydroneopterin aldolase [Campylobacter sp. TTU_617]MBK1972584.1 dihydroneopterin aldolase [Campylobacter sp. TTU-622]MBK1991132.1 dihydroneopterin aldolase [Campylobacter sp. 2018MI34]
MEFLELLLVLIALILMIKKPEKEKLAFTLVIIAWLMMVFFYVGHKTGALLTIMNL